jgi:hypothetical protein
MLAGWSKQRRDVVPRRKRPETALITDLQGEASVLAGVEISVSNTTGATATANSTQQAIKATKTSKATKANKKNASRKDRGKGAAQQEFAFLEDGSPAAPYEYAVLITSTDYDIPALAQLYRDRPVCRTISMN